MNKDKKAEKKLEEKVEEKVNEVLRGKLSTVFGNEPRETSAVPKPPTPKKISLIAEPPRVPKPPQAGQQRRHPMDKKGEIRYWISTVIEFTMLGLGIMLIVTAIILIVKWGQWLWRII